MMSCPIDQAAAVEQLDREASLRRQIANRGPVVHATGACLDCDAPLDDVRRWCDADCRDAWEAARRPKH